MKQIQAKGILSTKNGMNVYRGCTHGCIYCDARSLCYHTPIPFEDIEAKINAPELLEKALISKRKKCMIGTGAMCDPYMPIEKHLQLTRKTLELIEKHNFGVAIQTKSDLILRDIDLLQKINNKTKAVVQITLTTASDNLCKIVEPNVCPTSRRVEILQECKNRGIPTVVWICPILPFINDTIENLQTLLTYCKETNVKGIINFGMGLTLREGNREYFYAQLDKHFPGLKETYIKTYGNSYDIPSKNSPHLFKLFYDFCHQNKIMSNPDQIFAYMNTFEEKNPIVQLELF